MKFKNGQEAVEFYVEAKNNVELENRMTLMIVEDQGHRLQYKNTEKGNNPMWAAIIDTLVDVERMLFKELTRQELVNLMRFFFFGLEPLPAGVPILDASFEGISERGKRKRVQTILQKLEAVLYKNHYLRRP